MANSPESSFHPKYRPDIDGLRAIAVLAVVIFHAFPRYLPGGFIGVDIFFVISGYLITSIITSNLNAQTFSFLDFYSRRVRRIFPTLIVVLLFTYFCGWFLLSNAEYEQVGKHIAAGASFISNFILWAESGYFDNAAETKPLLHLWSLGIEEQFYLIAPLFFWCIHKFKKFPIIVAALALMSFGINIFLKDVSLTADFFSPFGRSWELLVGSLLSLYRQEMLQKSKWSGLLPLFGLTLLVVGFCVINPEVAFPGWWALIPVLGTALIIFSDSKSWINRRILSNSLLVWIGVISYPFYLWHWPIFTFWRLTHIQEIGYWTYLGLIFVSVIFSYVTYLLIEGPIRRRASWIVTVLLLILMLLVGVIGINCFYREGLPMRAAVQKKFNFQLESAYCPDRLCEDQIANFKLDRPIVMVFGDSHAAHLYAGLRKQANLLHFNLYMADQPACPPMVNYLPRGEKSGAMAENYKCSRHINEAIKFIDKFHPQTIILAANWLQYDGVNSLNYLSDDSIRETIELLKSKNIKNIYLIGNFPVFNIEQPRLAAELFSDGSINRTYKRFNYSSVTSDTRMQNISKENTVDFISPIKILCNSDGCLFSSSKEELIPIGADLSHFTKAGSIFFIENAIAFKSLNLP